MERLRKLDSAFGSNVMDIFFVVKASKTTMKNI
jgi:hypothetical protein